MPGIAGRRALVKITGAAVAFAAEATTDAGDHKTYQITNATKRVWDRSAAITVKNNGVAVNSATDPYTVNRLTGKIVFTNADGTRVITVDGQYLPTSVAAGARTYGWSLARQVLDDTDYDSANTNSNFPTTIAGMLDVSGTIGRRVTSDTVMRDAMLAGVPVVLEFYTDRSQNPDLLVWALLSDDTVQAPLTGRVDGDTKWSGAADADGRAASLP